MSANSCEQTAPIAVLLAAGKSRRFGTDKRLALVYEPRLASKIPMLLAGYLKLRRELAAVIIVVAKNEETWLRALFAEYELDLRASDAICEVKAESEPGLSTSIAIGATYCAQKYPARAVLVALADMPALTRSSLQLLLKRWAEVGAGNKATGAARLAFDDKGQVQPGHPVVFASAAVTKLRELSGDGGARPVLEGLQCELVKVNDIGVVRDVDQPEHLQELKSILGKNVI